MLAPIVLFVYNRPSHTKRTIEALSRNQLAIESDLYIYSDAPKAEIDNERVSLVRAIIRNVNGFKSVSIIESSENKGLASSIIMGVSEACSVYGQVIVLEDDVEVSPFFLRFMNDALAFYYHQEKVMHISACTYPIDTSVLEREGKETFFFRVPLCWGWATWKTSWERFDRNILLVDKFNLSDVYRFNVDGAYPYYKQLESNRNGEIKTWFVYWYAALYFHEGLALFPSKSLANNIGHDGSGIHCSSTDLYAVEINAKPVKVDDLDVVESAVAVKLHKEYFERNLIGFWRRIIRKFNKLLEIFFR